MARYTYQDIVAAYKKLGVEKGRLVFLGTDLRYLGPYGEPGRDALLKAHFQALDELIDLGKGNLMVCTSSTYLCNTDTPYDAKNTPSELGVLTEYIRKQPGAVRSDHAFVSHSAIGSHAEHICHDVSRHAYGPHTPMERAIELDALFVSIGLHPRLTCSVVHHAEHLMAVPYRYTKEFLHPVVRGSGMTTEPYYMYVWYRACNIKKNRNVKIYRKFLERGHELREEHLGEGLVYSFSLRELFSHILDMFRDNIYEFLDEVPEEKPYRM